MSCLYKSLLVAKIKLFAAFSRWKHVSVCLQLKYAVLSFISRKTTSLLFCCYITLFSALSYWKHVSVCLRLNYSQRASIRPLTTELDCFEIYLTDNNVLAFLVLNYAVFTFYRTKNMFLCVCSQIMLFSVFFPCLQFNTAFFSSIYLHTTFLTILMLFNSVFRVKHKFVEWLCLDKLLKLANTVRVAVLKLIELTCVTNKFGIHIKDWILKTIKARLRILCNWRY